MGFKCESSGELWLGANQIATEAEIPKWEKTERGEKWARERDVFYGKHSVFSQAAGCGA